MPRLDPEALKRNIPNWGGIPVIMADGQVWTLAKPFVRYVPTDDDIGFRICLQGEHGPKFEDLMEQYDILGSASPDGNIDIYDLAKIEIGLAKLMLQTNYSLTDKDLGRLVQFGYRDGDVEGVGLREAVMAIAFGNNGPKPSAVGDVSPSSPTD